MPLVYTEAIWRSLYRRWNPDTQTAETYGPGHRRPGNERGRIIAHQLLDLPGFSESQTVAAIGAGFGYELEALLDAGINVYGIDASPYVFEHPEHIPDVIRPILHQATVGAGLDDFTADWVITLDAISSQSDDAGVELFLDACEAIGGGEPAHVIHIVTPLDANRGPGDTALLWRTFDEWVDVRPTHRWLHAGHMMATT